MGRRGGARFGRRSKRLEGGAEIPGRRRYSLAKVQSLRLRLAINGPVSAMYSFM